MATVNISLSLPNRDAATLSRLEAARDTHVLCDRLSQLLVSVASGNERPSVMGLSISENGTRATGVVTCASVAAADTVTINGVVFTAVAGSPTGNQFDQSLASDTLVAADLVRSVNASATAAVSGFVTAANVAGAVTFTATAYDTTGNFMTLASSNGSRLAVTGVTNGRLAGGVKDATAITVTF